MKKWQGIHRLMRAGIAFQYHINFNDPVNHFKLYQPCFLMPSGHIDNHVYYPRTSKSVQYSFGLVENGYTDQKTVNFYYTTLPQYFLMTTNMKYSQNNMERIQEYMRNTEKYDGVLKTDQDNDVENWRSHWDIGFSDHGSNGNSKFMYYGAHGNFCLPQFFPGGDAYNNYTHYANA